MVLRFMGFEGFIWVGSFNVLIMIIGWLMFLNINIWIYEIVFE